MEPQPSVERNRNQDSRQRLIEAAIRSILEIGYARTTIREVVNRAGMTKGAHVYLFGNKMDLMKETARYLFEQVHRRMGDLKLSQPKSVEDIEDNLQAIADVTLDREGVALLEFWMASRTDADLRGVFSALEAHNQQVRAERLRCTYGKELSDAGDLPVLTDGVILIVRGLALQQVFDQSARQGATWLFWRRRIAEDIHACIHGT